MAKKRATVVYARRAGVAAAAGVVAREDAPDQDWDRIRSNDIYRAIVREVFGGKVHRMPAAMALDLGAASTAADLLTRARTYVPAHPQLRRVLELWQKTDPRPGAWPTKTRGACGDGNPVTGPVTPQRKDDDPRCDR